MAWSRSSDLRVSGVASSRLLQSRNRRQTRGTLEKSWTLGEGHTLDALTTNIIRGFRMQRESWEGPFGAPPCWPFHRRQSGEPATQPAGLRPSAERAWQMMIRRIQAAPTLPAQPGCTACVAAPRASRCGLQRRRGGPQNRRRQARRDLPEDRSGWPRPSAVTGPGTSPWSSPCSVYRAPGGPGGGSVHGSAGRP